MSSLFCGSVCIVVVFVVSLSHAETLASSTDQSLVFIPVPSFSSTGMSLFCSLILGLRTLFYKYNNTLVRSRGPIWNGFWLGLRFYLAVYLHRINLPALDVVFWYSKFFTFSEKLCLSVCCLLFVVYLFRTNGKKGRATPSKAMAARSTRTSSSPKRTGSSLLSRDTFKF